MFAVAISTVILPSLSRGNVSNDLNKFNRTMDWGVRMVLLLGIPAVFGIIVLRHLIIATIFMRGEFSPDDVVKSAASLFACSIGLLSYMLVKVFAPAFYAKQDTKTPVKCAVIAVLSNIFFNLALVYPLDYIGLALSTTLSGTINMLLLARGLYRRNIYHIPRETYVYAFKLLIGSIAMSAAILLLQPDIETITAYSNMQRCIWLGGLIALGGAVYFAVSMICGIRKTDLRVNEEL
jgi:putative peptidoglycan lipid II flippase